MSRRCYAAVLILTLSATHAAACGSGRSSAGAAEVQTPLEPGVSIRATIDEKKPTGELLERVRVLAAQVEALMKAGKEDEAYAAEEQAMALLGLQKFWMRCGPGTFGWMEALPTKQQ